MTEVDTNALLPCMLYMDEAACNRVCNYQCWDNFFFGFYPETWDDFLYVACQKGAGLSSNDKLINRCYYGQNNE